MTNKRDDYKWCCIDKDFHQMLKIKAQQKGMKLIDFTKEIANADNPLFVPKRNNKHKNRFQVL